MTPDEIQRVIVAAYKSALADRRIALHGARWVMNSTWFDRLHQAFISPEIEAQIRSSHAAAKIEVMATFPHDCPVCTSGPFATMDDLTAHVMAMVEDPMGQSSGACLFGLPIDVQDHGGAPHLQGPLYAQPPHA